jgi:hypothetical protein
MKVIEVNASKIIELPAQGQTISNGQEALELLMNGNYLGTRKILLYESNLNADFFRLQSGVAGDILQKFSLYDGFLAIVGDFEKYESSSLQSFIKESNRQGRIQFFGSREEAIHILQQKIEKE